MSKKGEGRSQVSALITGDEVIVQPIVNPDLSIAFDKKPTKVSLSAYERLVAVLLCVDHVYTCSVYAVINADIQKRYSYS